LPQPFEPEVFFTMHQIIQQAIEVTKRDLPDHFAGLLKEREGGSKWGREFTEADFGLEWNEVTEKVDSELRRDGFHYFNLAPSMVEAAFPNRTLGAIPLNQLEPEELANVKLRKNPHGTEVELWYDGELDLESCEDEAWLVIGPGEPWGAKGLVVFTAHPGPLMKALPAESFKDFFEKPFAVKL